MYTGSPFLYPYQYNNHDKNYIFDFTVNTEVETELTGERQMGSFREKGEVK